MSELALIALIGILLVGTIVPISTIAMLKVNPANSHAS